MGRADRNGQGIHAGLLDELFDLVRLGQHGLAAVGGFQVHAADVAQLGLDADAVRRGNVYGRLGQLYVFLEGQARTVDHHRRKTLVDRTADRVQFRGVVQMQDDGNVVVVGHGLGQSGLVGPAVTAAAFQVDLQVHQDDGGAKLLGRFQDRADHHVFDRVERRDRIVVCSGMVQDLFECGKHGAPECGCKGVSVC